MHFSHFNYHDDSICEQNIGNDSTDKQLPAGGNYANCILGRSKFEFVIFSRLLQSSPVGSFTRRNKFLAFISSFYLLMKFDCCKKASHYCRQRNLIHGTASLAMINNAGKLFYLYFQSFCFADLVIQPAWCNLTRLVLEWVINPLPFRQIIWLRLYWISDDMMGGGGLVIHQRMRVSHVNTLRMMWLCNFSWFVIQIASRRGIINSRPRAWDGGRTS